MEITEQNRRMSGNIRIAAEQVGAAAGGLLAGMERANGPVPVTLEVLREALALQVAAGMRVHEVVGAARRNGVTWEAIGQPLGISKQAAQQRFGR